ncbi:MAG: DUF308 domain-containing protein [Lachnospiraceae bacterium]|nr:DUF308 domain-containing protein [Lachnospiraceae bacterium]
MVEKIKADLKKIRRGKVFAAIISLVIGVVLLVYPMTSLEVIVRMIGIALIISGLYAVLMFIVNGEDRSVGALIGGILLGVIGAGIFYRPDFLVSFIPTLIGVLVVASGIANICEAITLSKMKYQYWYISLILGLLTVIFGGLLIYNPFGAAEVMTRIVGVTVIFDAITNLWIIAKVSSNIKNVSRNVKQARDEYNAYVTQGMYVDEGTTPQQPAQPQSASDGNPQA